MENPRELIPSGPGGDRGQRQVHFYCCLLSTNKENRNKPYPKHLSKTKQPKNLSKPYLGLSLLKGLLASKFHSQGSIL